MDTFISKDIDLLIFFDACRFSSNAGEIKILNQKEISTFSTSTHTSSMSVIIEYIHRFSDVMIKVVGINIKNAHFAPEISPKIKESADSLIMMIEDATR